jgi:hypothetical protein
LDDAAAGALVAETLTVPGLGCVPPVHAVFDASYEASAPGLMVMVHSPSGDNVAPVQLSVVICVPGAKEAGVTVNGVVVSVVLVFLMVMSLEFPDSAAFVYAQPAVADGQFTASASVAGVAVNGVLLATPLTVIDEEDSALAR